MQPWETCAECPWPSNGNQCDGPASPKPRRTAVRLHCQTGPATFAMAARRNDGGQDGRDRRRKIDDNDLAKSAAYFAGLPTTARPNLRWQRTFGGLAARRPQLLSGRPMRFSGHREAAVPVHDDAEPKPPGTRPLLKAQHAGYPCQNNWRDWQVGANGRNDSSQIMPGRSAAKTVRPGTFPALATFLAFPTSAGARTAAAAQ